MNKAVFVMPDAQVYALARVIAGTYVGLCIESQRFDDSGEGLSSDGRFEKLWERFRNAPKFPTDSHGCVPMEAIDEPWDHVGLIGHLHITRRKWDPAGLNWSKCESAVAEYMDEIFVDYMSKKR